MRKQSFKYFEVDSRFITDQFREPLFSQNCNKDRIFIPSFLGKVFLSVVYFELLLNKPQKSRFSQLRVWLRSNWLSSRAGRKDFFSNDAIKTFKSLSPNRQLLFFSYKNKKH